VTEETQTEPLTVLAALEKAATELDAMTNRLGRAVKQFETTVDEETGELVLGPGIRYDIAVKDKRIQIYDNAIENDKRPPAEDIRQAKAEKMVRDEEPELWADYQQLSTEMSALRIGISARKESIRARQSILKGERD
jgi:hypothetical protein